jgi:hypothetical protein
MTIDTSGNTIIAGEFRGTIDFGGGPLTTGPANTNVFVAKIDPTGAHIWSKRFGDAGRQSPAAIAVSASGHILITGNFEGTLDFGGGPLTGTPSPAEDAFAAVLDASGAHVWSAKYGDATGGQGGMTAALDSGGNAFVAGYSSAGSIDLGGGALSTPFYDAWLAKFSPAGAHLWSRRIGDVSSDPADFEYQYIIGVTADLSDNVVVLGMLRGTADLGNGPETATAQDMFIVRYDAGGNYISDQIFAATGSGTMVNAGGLAVDGSGNLAVGGVYSGVVDFGGGDLPEAGTAPFLVSFDSAGNHRWSHGFPANNQTIGNGVATNSAGEISFVGEFSDSLNLGGGWLDAPGDYTLFVAKYDADGVYKWSKGLEPFSPGGVTAMEAGGDVYISGYFGGAIDFGGGTFTSIQEDAFLARYGDDTLLPVLITRFDARPDDAGVTLQWELWSDEAISGFTLLRGDGSEAPRVIAEISDEGVRSFVDRAIERGRRYEYQLLVNTRDGDTFRSPLVPVTTAGFSLALGDNRPNPFNPQTTIPYQVPTAATPQHVNLRVFDASGVLVRTLVNDEQSSGAYSAVWDGRDDRGRTVASGVYFSVLQIGKEQRSRKMVMLK